MHQPYYRDDVSGETVMPWVFLHAIKDYYDMPWYIDQQDNIKATFNLVPSLLVQLKTYENYDVNDKFLNALKKEINDLTFKEKVYLVEYLFFSNEHHMIKPFARYNELFEQKKLYKDLEEMAVQFSTTDLLDLEVLFILSWCGNYLRENNNIVKTLIEKGTNYTQYEKIELLKSLTEFIKEIVPYHKKLIDEKKIQVSTTPFNHPISPLLFDINNGHISNPNTSMPNVEGSFKEDAYEQIDRAVNYYEQLFDKKPVGFWPAEGSISYDFLHRLSQKDVKWACSDEEVLYKTLQAHEKSNIYDNNKLIFEDKEINLFFRDRELSDLLGFSYSGWDADSAVEDFINRLKSIYDGSQNNRNVNIILDGENAWEHYPDNAMHFFKKLYSRIEECEWCKTRFFDEVMSDESIQTHQLRHIEPGSWINGNFNIWIGHEEKNRAWELLFKTKVDFDKKADTLDEESLKQIKKEFLVAQSSDWFWWFGDDHHTDLKTTFDSLFRKHLINIYTLMNEDVPKELHTPIVQNSTVAHNFLTTSKNQISASIDGKISHYFEWLGAGVCDLSAELSSMSMTDFLIQKIYFGSDENEYFFAFEGDIEKLLENGKIELEIDEKTTLHLPISKELTVANSVRCKSDEIIEIAIKKELIENEEINFKLFLDNKLIQLLPLYSKLAMRDLEEKNNWYI
jgi:alpha-amylase/alpha-mannosidase (GH57 family)